MGQNPMMRCCFFPTLLHYPHSDIIESVLPGACHVAIIRCQNHHAYHLCRVVSTLVQILKRAMPNAYWTLGLVAVLSIVAAGAYTALEAVGLWQTAH